MLTTTPYHIGARYMGIVTERPGQTDHPAIQFWLSLCNGNPDAPDEIPWCSAFAHFAAWQLNLPRSKSLAARSWLKIGLPVDVRDAAVGFDVVILSRGSGPQPGPDVLAAPGHVGFYGGRTADTITLLGGNQGNTVSLQWFPLERVLGVRRLR